MDIKKRLSLLEQIQPNDSIDLSSLSDEEYFEVVEIVKKTGENEDYSLLSNKELHRLIELIEKAENEADIKATE